ncbi:MAG: UbiA family prenyltransferase, partial [Anaerolineae bacterium]|nr:UbiA family prenyltransferase [Anaerolineae bacterium]
KPVRLKALPVLDLISHVLMLSTLLLLSAYMVYDPAPREVWLLVISVSLISAYGQLYNQVRDYEADQAAGLHNTASLLGKSGTQRLGYAMLVIALGCLLASILSGAFPLWLGGVLLVVVPLVRRVVRGRDMRGDASEDPLADGQVQFLLAANLVLVAWLGVVLVS